MKKILTLLAAAALLMTACSPNDRVGSGMGTDGGTSPVTDNGGAGSNAEGGSDMTNGAGTDDASGNTASGGASDNARTAGEGTGSLARRDSRRTMSGWDRMGDTLGDRDGDGFIENTLIDGPDGVTGSFSYRRVHSVDTAEDARNFIGSNLLSLCTAALPGMAEVRVLDSDERDRLAEKTGITDADGVRDVVIAQASGDDEDFSVVMLRTDGTHTSALTHELGRRVDTAGLHTCPAGERTVSVTLDDDVVLLSGNRAEVAAALQALMRAADGVYDSVGSARVIETS